MRDFLVQADLLIKLLPFVINFCSRDMETWNSVIILGEIHLQWLTLLNLNFFLFLLLRIKIYIAFSNKHQIILFDVVTFACYILWHYWWYQMLFFLPQCSYICLKHFVTWMSPNAFFLTSMLLPLLATFCDTMDVTKFFFFPSMPLPLLAIFCDIMAVTKCFFSSPKSFFLCLQHFVKLWMSPNALFLLNAPTLVYNILWHYGCHQICILSSMLLPLFATFCDIMDVTKCFFSPWCYYLCLQHFVTWMSPNILFLIPLPSFAAFCSTVHVTNAFFSPLNVFHFACCILSHCGCHQCFFLSSQHPPPHCIFCLTLIFSVLQQ